MKALKLIFVLINCAYLTTSFASAKLTLCKDFKQFTSVEQQIRMLDQKFYWQDKNCKLVITNSLFPKQDSKGIYRYRKGRQLFIYQNDLLKFVCVPGWVCKSWV